MDKIFVFGDSHTYGDGLDDCKIETPWKDHSTQTWPYYMYAENKIKNLAYPGCSNDMIALRMIRYVEPNSIVLANFASPYRLQFTCKGFNFNVLAHSSYPISDSVEENKFAIQLTKQLENLKLLGIYEDIMLEFTMLKNILICQQLCKQKNCAFYFTMVGKRDKTKCGSSLQKYQTAIYNEIDWTKCFLVDNQYGFEDYAEKINAERNSDGMHYSEQYHKLFGELFLDWINTKKKV